MTDTGVTAYQRVSGTLIGVAGVDAVDEPTRIRLRGTQDLIQLVFEIAGRV
jgi:hypothetical protein